MNCWPDEAVEESRTQQMIALYTAERLLVVVILKV